ncbi:MAG: RNA polymerase sigma factor [Chlorobi bacterium]|nr:RNA polymerase sigma factor [Chlorobiota bacterium]MBX7215523.1 RNA polymerase sigma factor [Candidatus Kapabacteria bacterium]
MASELHDRQQRFMALLRPLQPNLDRFAYAMARDREEARDIAGETILIAWERFESVRQPQAFLSFLFTIATRVHRKRRAYQQRHPQLPDGHVADLYDTSTPPDIAADVGALHTALQQLPEKQREAVMMFELLGFSMKEIQQIQGGTLVAVKVRISRGRKRLAELLGVRKTQPDQSHKREMETEMPSGIETLKFSSFHSKP